MRVRNTLPFVIALTMIAAAATGVSAHRLDEYLQAARIGLQPDGVLVELDLTPGAAAAESIIAIIDRDRDGLVSADEQQAYAGQVVRALKASVDGHSLPLRLTSASFPAVSAFRRGEGTIRLQATAAHPSLPIGAHALYFKNDHLIGQSVYLVNALVPESANVSVAAQLRDRQQSEVTIDYSIRGRSVRATLAWLFAGLTAAGALGWFVRRPFAKRRTAARP